MVSPFCTLQSSNSLRNSIASLAWFKASCIAPGGGLHAAAGRTRRRPSDRPGGREPLTGNPPPALPSFPGGRGSEK